MKKNKKKIENPFCDLSYLMRHGCNGCVKSKKCEEWHRKKKVKLNEASKDVHS